MTNKDWLEDAANRPDPFQTVAPFNLHHLFFDKWISNEANWGKLHAAHINLLSPPRTHRVNNKFILKTVFTSTRVVK